MKKILIIRNDKLGDFVLSFPSYALAKKNLPNTQIHALVPSYTQPIAEVCSFIDKVIVDPGKSAGLKKNLFLLKQIKDEKYDAVITLFSTTRIGLICRLAAIPFRLAPATKLAQIFYNYKLPQHRSRSEKPEYAYNMDLIYYFFKLNNIREKIKPNLPYLKFSKEETNTLKLKFIQQYDIPENHQLIFIHAGCGGSANNMSPQQFADLAKKLTSLDGHTIVVTAGPNELDIAKTIANELTGIPHVIYESIQGILAFTKHIQLASLFIAGSTGPLHIAGALNTPTAGFYPRRRSATELRWQTLNSKEMRLAFSPNENASKEDMSAINIDDAAKEINSKILMED